MNALPGIGGSLFPGRYLVDGFPAASAIGLNLERVERRRRQMDRWWQVASTSCGPATGLRGIIDAIALPLAGALEFRTAGIAFERRHAVVTLECSTGTPPVGLLVMPWAATRTSIWRDVASTARTMSARWCFVLAPPFLSLVDARGHVTRHSVDFTLPDVLAPECFLRFWAIAGAHAFRPPPQIDALVKGAAGFQDAVRADLQFGVLEALSALGGALRSSPDALDEGLTLVYRLLFLLFAESRDLVPRAHPVYGKAYSINGFCQTALGSDAPAGLWDGLAAVTRLSRVGCRVDDLIVRPFNGRLFARSSAPSLEAGTRRGRPRHGVATKDAAMQRALVALSTRRGRAGREHISYADLGVEQLGAVYERVLDADIGVGPSPATTATPRRPAARRHSLRRKQTGTFYTPQSLAEFVVRRTLAPLVLGAGADEILTLRVVDPAMGSGAFLVAACRYLAHAYERALVDEGRCAETDLDDHERANIRRLIAERCLAGVDVNPVAVQLARLSLWLTTLARGKPLGFLDHRLRVGNSLIGASPDDLRRVSTHTQRAASSSGRLPLFDTTDLEASMRLTTRPLLELSVRPDDTVEDVRAKETLWSRLSGAESPLAMWRDATHLWCARWFVDSPPSPAELRAALDAVLRNDSTLRGPLLTRRLAAAREAAAAHGFFHWPLEFADVFYDERGQPKANAGFDAVIGNPPWEMVRGEAHCARRTTHDAPRTTHNALRTSHSRDLVRFVRDSGLFNHCDRGHLNLYQPFVERALTLARPGGRVGLILPWGLAVDDGAAGLRTELLGRSGLDTVVGLDNGSGLFPIHRGLRFLVAVATPAREAQTIRGRFGVRTAEELDSLPDREDSPAGLSESAAFPVRLSPRDLRIIGGPTVRIPDARAREDLALLERLSRDHPALGDPDGWAVRFGRELNATEDRGSFGTRGLPIVEGKHLSPFVTDVTSTIFSIERRVAVRLLPDQRFDRPRLAYRDVSGVGNRVSLIAALVPAGVVTTHTVFCLRSEIPIERHHFLCGLFNSYVLNAVTRLLMGGHVTTSLVEGLPVPAWTGDAAQHRIARLARTLQEKPAALEVEAELQSAVARLYALDDETFRHVLRGFPLVPAAQREAALAALTVGAPARTFC